MRSSLYIRLFFLFLAGLLVAVAVFEHRRSREKEQLKKDSALIFQNRIRQSIIRLSLVKEEGSQFVLEKTEQGWQLIQPVKDMASSGAVEGLLDDLFNESAEVLSEGNVQWSDYGLDPPFSVLSLQSASEKWNIGISSESSFDGKFYIKKDIKLLLGSSAWGRLARPWTDAYRSRALYSKRKKILKLYYKTQKRNYEFIRKDDKWHWNLETPLSQEAVESLIDLLKGEMISAFSSRKKTVFTKPDLEIQVVNENQKDTWVLKLKKINKEKAQVTLSDRDFIYELNAIESLLELDFQEKKEDSSETESEKKLSDNN